MELSVNKAFSTFIQHTINKDLADEIKQLRQKLRIILDWSEDSMLADFPICGDCEEIKQLECGRCANKYCEDCTTIIRCILCDWNLCYLCVSHCDEHASCKYTHCLNHVCSRIPAELIEKQNAEKAEKRRLHKAKLAKIAAKRKAKQEKMEKSFLDAFHKSDL
jgi:hypothetical protein